jgi:hypothetical protein
MTESGRPVDLIIGKIRRAGYGENSYLNLYLYKHLKLLLMKRKVTFSDLFLLAYDEVDGDRKAALLSAVDQNQKLKKTYQDILAIKKVLESSMAGPSEQALNNIFAYSKALEVVTTKDQSRSFYLIKN